MKKRLILIICLSLILTACNGGNGNTPPAGVETDVQSPADEAVLVLKAEKVEIVQDSAFDPHSLIEGGNFDEISFSSIDTSVLGDQELLITITKSGKTKEYTVVVTVVAKETEISWQMMTEGPVFLIHPDKLMGYEGEENYKSFYEYPVFTSNPPEVAERINRVINEEHIWSIAEAFTKMSNTISPGYDRADILQARTTVSEGKMDVVVHTEYILTLYQTGHPTLSHIVTIFEKTSGYPLSAPEQLQLYGLDAEAVIERLETFIAGQEYNTQKMGLEPYRPDMTPEEEWAYSEDIYGKLDTDDYVMIFLEEDIEVSDLQAKLIFIKDGKLYSEFFVFDNMGLGLGKLLFEVGSVN